MTSVDPVWLYGLIQEDTFQINFSISIQKNVFNKQPPGDNIWKTTKASYRGQYLIWKTSSKTVEQLLVNQSVYRPVGWTADNLIRKLNQFIDQLDEQQTIPLGSSVYRPVGWTGDHSIRSINFELMYAKQTISYK